MVRIRTRGKRWFGKYVSTETPGVPASWSMGLVGSHRALCHAHASSSALASWRSAVSKPSVNQP